MRQLEKGTDSNWAKYLCHGCEALLEVEEVLSVAVALSLWHFQPARAGRSGPAARRAPTIVGLVRAVFTLLQPPRPLREGQRIVAQLRGEGHLPGAPLPREFGISNRRKKKNKTPANGSSLEMARARPSPHRSPQEMFEGEAVPASRAYPCRAAEVSLSKGEATP